MEGSELDILYWIPYEPVYPTYMRTHTYMYTYTYTYTYTHTHACMHTHTHVRIHICDNIIHTRTHNNSIMKRLCDHISMYRGHLSSSNACSLVSGCVNSWIHVYICSLSILPTIAVWFPTILGAPETAVPPAGLDSMGTGGCIADAPVEMTFCTGDDKERRGKV